MLITRWVLWQICRLDIALAPLSENRYSPTMVSLSGPLSRRRLGTQSGDMRREARKLGGRAGQYLEMEAAKQRASEGSAITSSEETIAERNATMGLERGLMRQKRDSLLKPQAADTAAPAATPAPTPTQGTTPSPLRRPAAALREGRIDGMPASQALRRLGAPAAEPGNMEDVRQSISAGPAAPGPLQSILNGALTRIRTQPNVPDDPASRAAGLESASVRSAAANTPKVLINPPAFDYRGRQLPNLAGTGVPVPTTPAAPAATPERSLSYRLGRGIRETPGIIKLGASKVVDAVSDAADAVGIAVGETGLRTGRKLKRTTSNFRAGLSGR